MIWEKIIKLIIVSSYKYFIHGFVILYYYIKQNLTVRKQF